MQPQMQVTVEEMATLLGVRDVEIFFLQKQLAAAQKRIAELDPKPEVQPELKVVP